MRSKAFPFDSNRTGVSIASSVAVYRGACVQYEVTCTDKLPILGMLLRLITFLLRCMLGLFSRSFHCSASQVGVWNGVGFGAAIVAPVASSVFWGLSRTSNRKSRLSWMCLGLLLLTYCNRPAPGFHQSGSCCFFDRDQLVGFFNCGRIVPPAIRSESRLSV